MSTTAPANGRLTRASLLRRVKVRDYKSIACCDVELGALTVLVGRNGSGKSNFLDALGFVADVLRLSFYDALVSRGGPVNVWRKAMNGSRGVAVELDVALGDDGRWANYGLEFGFTNSFEPAILSERLVIVGVDNAVVAAYEVSNGECIRSTEVQAPPVSDDRLYLSNAAGLPAFRDVYNALLGMKVYHFNTESMKAKQTPNVANDRVLREDGSNLAGVIRRISQDRPKVKERIQGYLESILPGLVNPETDRLLVAQIRDGDTKIAGVDRASREAIKEHLFSAGQLLSMDQLEPDWRDLERQRQSEFFKGVGGPA
ncbi:MAG: AAA family ATPase [Planctomycetia bacterium]|nr:AAA family ATPase [Planctomycetia bacterium]